METRGDTIIFCKNAPYANSTSPLLSQKLYTTGQIGTASTDLVMIVARASGLALEEIDGPKSGSEADLTSRLQADGLQLTYPVLETDEGDLITESTAICQLLAAMGSKPELAGTTPAEQAKVDQWTLFIRSKTILLAKALAGAAYGTVKMTGDEHAYLSGKMKENLLALNKNLNGKEWFCGGANPTIVDYLFVIALAEMLQCIIDPNLRTSINFLNNHFKKVAALEEVKGRLGNLKIGKKQVQAVCLAKQAAEAPVKGKNNKKPKK